MQRDFVTRYIAKSYGTVKNVARLLNTANAMYFGMSYILHYICMQSQEKKVEMMELEIRYQKRFIVTDIFKHLNYEYKIMIWLQYKMI